MKQLIRIFASVFALACLSAVAWPSQAQQNIKLYVFTSGSLGGFPKAALQIGGQGNVDWAPVSFYVITTPRGNIMFDTGNNDKTITDPDQLSPCRMRHQWVWCPFRWAEESRTGRRLRGKRR